MRPRTEVHRLLLLAITMASLSAVRHSTRADEAVAVVASRPGSIVPVRSGPEELIVELRAGADENDVARLLYEAGAARARRSRFGARYLVTMDDGLDAAMAVERLRAMPEVDYAEPNGQVRALQARPGYFTPNDKRFGIQWNFRMIGMERTWGIQRGRSDVVVAVLDTGVAYEDFGPYRKAPDWGGAVFRPGYDFINGDSHPDDDNYHGTHVASTIAEATNNDLSFTGMAFDCAIMPVKVLDATGFGSYFAVADGVDFAVANGAKVINLSLGGEGNSETLRRAIDAAVGAGVVVVAAAGNDGRDGLSFPASLANVIAVGALDARKVRADYSNRGANLSVVAPGGDCDRNDSGNELEADCIWQQGPNPSAVAAGRYDSFVSLGLSGTSQATPHVSALAALLVAQGFVNPRQVRAAIEASAEDLGPSGRDDEYGHGMIRPELALSGLGFNQ